MGGKSQQIAVGRLNFLDKVIRSVYANGGSKAVQSLLPDLEPSVIRLRARHLGIKAKKSVANVAYKNSKPESDVEFEPVRRVCLRCRESFTANGRYIRLCITCKQRASWSSGWLA